MKGKLEAAIGREKIWREAPPGEYLPGGHRRVVSKDRFGEIAADNRQVAGSPVDMRHGGRSHRSNHRSIADKKRSNKKKEERTRLPRAIDHNTASLRKPKAD